jgi:hypothetical protein
MNTTTEETKQITFEGLPYTVPTWVKWVARDEDGEIIGYETRPINDRLQWYSSQGQSVGRNIQLGWRCQWQESLTEV